MYVLHSDMYITKTQLHIQTKHHIGPLLLTYDTKKIPHRFRPTHTQDLHNIQILTVHSIYIYM